MADPECPEVHPFTLMRDPEAYMRWQGEVGVEEAGRVVTEATRAAMREHGPRVVIAIGQRMDDLTARLEEMTA